MIFVTVGTEKFPFDRLIRAIDKGLERGGINDRVFAGIVVFLKNKNGIEVNEKKSL